MLRLIRNVMAISSTVITIMIVNTVRGFYCIIQDNQKLFHQDKKLKLLFILKILDKNL